MVEIIALSIMSFRDDAGWSANIEIVNDILCAGIWILAYSARIHMRTVQRMKRRQFNKSCSANILSNHCLIIVGEVEATWKMTLIHR